MSDAGSRRLHFLRKIPIVGIVGGGLTLACLVLFVLSRTGLGFIQAVSNYFYDGYLQQVHDPPKSNRIAIADLDDQSLQKPELGQWPWPRYLVADLTRKIHDAGASVLVFDIVFAEQDRTSPALIRARMSEYFKLDIQMSGIPTNLMDFDHLFADALKQSNTILGCVMAPCDEMVEDVDVSIDPFYKGHIFPRYIGDGQGKNINQFLMQASGMQIAFPVLLESAKTAFFNAVMDSDNIVRSSPLIWAYGSRRTYPSLALEAVRLDRAVDKCIVKYDSLGVQQIELPPGKNVEKGSVLAATRSKGIVIPADRQGRLIINYRSINKSARTGFVSSFPTYSACDILSGKVGRDELKDKIVFVGASAAGLKDLRATPLTEAFSGVEVHATMVDNMLAGDMLFLPNWLEGVHVMAILLTGLFLTLLISRGRAWLSFVVALILFGAAYGVGLFMLARYQIVFVPIWVIITIVVIYPTLTMIRFWQEELQKKRVRDMFGTMVSERVLHFLENNPGTFSLSGQRREATMFFADVAGFTTISESLPPEKLSELLNRYLSPMTHIIMEREGYVDKYEGDLIMAVWGVPYPLKTHATEGCLAALEQQAKLNEIRPILKKEFGYDIYVRMGMNSGPVTAGNMGSDRKFQYTVMGDAVNQAARFEPVNKDYGTGIIIGETTYLEAKDSIEARLLDRILVKGKTKPIVIYELIAKKGEWPEAKKKVVGLYEQALRLHWDRKWDEALDCLDSALKLDPEDGPSIRLRDRVAQYKETPPAADWGGEYVRAHKD